MTDSNPRAGSFIFKPPGAALLLLAAFSILLVMMAAFASPARSATFNVTNLNDSGAGSLRAAINLANGNGQTDTIRISVRGTVVLRSDLPDLTTNMHIAGPGADAFSLSGNGERRVFFVDDRATVTMSGIRVTGGRSNFGGGIFNRGVLNLEGVSVDGNSGTYGGGVCNAKSKETVNGGTLTIRNSDIRGNTASGFTTSSGGGIANGPLSRDGGTLTVINSTISGNTAVEGGGVSSDIDLPGQRTVISNSTISGNQANEKGGGFYNGSGSTTIAYSTITNNTAPNSRGSGVLNDNGGGKLPRTVVSSSIIAGNRGTDVDVRRTIANGGNTFVSRGYNMIGNGDARDGFRARGDRSNIANPGLFPLVHNGGNTNTHALRGSSPAVDGGGPGCPATDQRRVQRPQGGACDIGSFESPHTGGPGACTITGTSGHDILVGTPGRDVICSLGGNDLVFGLGGNDILLGGPGNDRLFGGPGNDRLVGGPGLDRLYGQGGHDFLNVRDSRPNDVADGGPGNDQCVADRGDNKVSCER